MPAPVIGSLWALAGCQGPLSTLDPGGPQAQSVFVFTWAMTAVAALLFVFVITLFAMALRRSGRVWRNRDPDRNADTARRSERRWMIGLGIAFPMSILTILLGATLWVGEGQFVRNDRLPTWRGTASQWGWQFAPVGADGAIGPGTDRLVIPAGEPVIVEIVSTDVIHSFWVPRLAGKMDAVPGKLNRHLIEADRPGTYLGVCAEYCGIGHDRMRFELVATPSPGSAAGEAQ